MPGCHSHRQVFVTAGLVTVGEWPLDDKAGSLARDTSSVGNHGHYPFGYSTNRRNHDDTRSAVIFKVMVTLQLTPTIRAAAAQDMWEEQRQQGGRGREDGGARGVGGEAKVYRKEKMLD